MRGVKLSETAEVTRESLALLQRDLLGSALAHAATSPFYAARFSAGTRTLDGLPLTTKEDLRAAYPFGLLATRRQEIATYHESSGTSGEPTASYFSDDDWDDVTTRFVRNAVDLGEDDTVMVKTPYAMVTTAHQMHRAARSRGAMVVPADNRSSNMPYPRVVRLLHDVPVTVAWCMPTEALLWTAAARRIGLEPSTDFPAFRAFVVAGEALGTARKRRLERLWSARVFEDYGSTETGSLAGECREGALHLWADRFLPEVLDPETGRYALEGRGQLVITTFFRQAMPLVRYLLEDTVEIGSRACGCGSPLPTIRVLGRTSTRAVTQGRPVFASDLDESVFELTPSYGVLFYRARHDDRALELEVETDAEHATAAERELAERVEARLGVVATVRGVPRGTIVPEQRLLAETPFQKPRLLFSRDEDWSQAIAY